MYDHINCLAAEVKVFPSIISTCQNAAASTNLIVVPPSAWPETPLYHRSAAAGHRRHNSNLIPRHPGLSWHPDRLSIITSTQHEMIFKWSGQLRWIRVCTNSIDLEQVHKSAAALVI